MDDKKTTVDKLPPYQFGNKEFALLNIQYVREYAEMRAHGYHESVAFVAVFGDDYQDSSLTKRIAELENNPVYRAEFLKALDSTKLHEMWNAKVAAHEVLAIARNPYAKYSTRLAAMKELNVMFEITGVDESGKPRAGRRFTEFYDAEDGAPVRHPEPGSPEAEQYVADTAKTLQ